MKFSTKGEYGTIIMVDLALHYGSGPVVLKDVAERQNLSEHYLEQLMGPLRRARLVESIRGARGGYMLARDPRKITVGDVIRVLEGPIAPVDCVVKGRSAEECKRGRRCVSRAVWNRVRESVEKVLDSISLADMCQEALALGYVDGREGIAPVGKAKKMG